MAKLSVVSVSDAERPLLQRTIKKGTSSARTITRARILLKADRGPEKQEWSDTKIAEAVEVSRPTVERLRKRAALDGVEAALRDRPRWENRHGKLDGEAEARLTALRCGEPPEGRVRWTLHLFADTFSEKEGVSVSYELVHRTLKKTSSPRTSSSNGASRPSRMLSSSGTLRTCSTSTPARTIPTSPRSALMSVLSSSVPMYGTRSHPYPVCPPERITSTSGAALPISSSGMSRSAAAAIAVALVVAYWLAHHGMQIWWLLPAVIILTTGISTRRTAVQD